MRETKIVWGKPTTSASGNAVVQAPGSPIVNGAQGQTFTKGGIPPRDTRLTK